MVEIAHTIIEVIRSYDTLQFMKLSDHTTELAPTGLAVVTASNLPTPAEKVRAWWRKARRVYPEATLRAWRFDWAAFLAFCKSRGLLPLPASPSTVAAYVEACGEAGKKPATVRRYLATIACAHRAAKLINPNTDEDVKLALKGLYNKSPMRQRQAKALGWHDVKKFLITAGDGIRADRERALLCVGYDTMARRSELVALDVEDFSWMDDGSGRVLIRRSKTDQAGEGSKAYLSPDTVSYLKAWLRASGISKGAVFRRLIGRGRIGDRLQVDAIAQTFKRVAEWVGMSGDEIQSVSGHSIRVGATQDMLALNIDLASVMQAGRWKTTAMPMRYGEEVQAGLGGMARTAKAQGRAT
jgi:integrase